MVMKTNRFCFNRLVTSLDYQAGRFSDVEWLVSLLVIALSFVHRGYQIGNHTSNFNQ